MGGLIIFYGIEISNNFEGISSKDSKNTQTNCKALSQFGNGFWTGLNIKTQIAYSINTSFECEPLNKVNSTWLENFENL